LKSVNFSKIEQSAAEL